MATVDDVTVLREEVLNAYSTCELLRNVIVKNDAAWLSDKISEFAGNLEDNRRAVGRLYEVALDAARQAAAIEKLPPFRLIDDELETATEGAGLLIFRYSNCFRRGDAAKIRATIVSTPAVDFEAARKRVLEEWAAAVRLLCGVVPTMATPIEANGDPPLMSSAASSDFRSVKGLTILAADQCPMIPKCVNDIVDMARTFGLEPKVVPVRSADASRKLPTPYGVFCIIYNGSVIVDRPVGGTRFASIISKALGSPLSGPAAVSRMRQVRQNPSHD